MSKYIRSVKILMLGFLIFASTLLQGQTYADWWYFGQKAGVHFTSGGPVAVLDGELSSIEGCASMSDNFGNLLFYTRGDTVWDASHNVMLNGTGLIANGVGGDGAMNSFIVPRPMNPTEYYLFTVKSYTGGLYYSKIDMTMNGGLGGVVNTEKNIPLVDTTLEMLTCLRHPNNVDFWVLTLAKPGDTAFAFSVTQNGVNTNPVMSNTGLVLEQIDQLGYLKGSQQNDKVALTLWKIQNTQSNANAVHLFDFDNASGSLSYNLAITPSEADTFNYGVEFSPSGQFLYVQSLFHPDLRQYDISSNNPATINASEVLIGPSYTGSAGGALQLGPDGQIYVARNSNTWLATVIFPDSPGLLCGYNHDAVNLSGRSCAAGLPQFFPFFISGSVAVVDNCFGDTSFFVSNYISADSVFWNFGDPASGILDTSTNVNPYHIYANPGTYTVTHIAYSAFLADTTVIELNILPRQSLNFPSDTLLCNGDTLLLDASQDGVINFLWNNGSTDSVLVITDSGLVTVTVTGVCDTVVEVVNVMQAPSPILDLGNDTIVCGADTFVLQVEIPDLYNALWNTGSSDGSIVVNESDMYHLVLYNACDTISDSIFITFLPVPADSMLPPDSIHCFDSPLLIQRPDVDGMSYMWSDSSDAKVISIDSTSLLWLMAYNACGTEVDSLSIIFNGEIKTELGEDTIICIDDSIVLRTNDSLANFTWNTGEVSDSIITTTGLSKNYIVTITLRECVKIESKRVTSVDTACAHIDCSLEYANVFTPNGDGMNDLFRISSDCDIYLFQMSIYNRWGQLVQKVQNIGHGWDGYVNGIPAAAGTYYFTVEHKDFVVVNSDRFFTRGSFSLLR